MSELTLNRLLRKPEVLALIGISSATLHRLIKAADPRIKFPGPVQIGPGSVAWRDVDVREWIETRPSAGAAPYVIKNS